MSGIRLEPFAESHLEPLAVLLADPDVQRYSVVPVPVPDGFERTWLEIYEQGRRDGSREAFAIVDSAESFLGIAVAFGFDRDTRTVELGYVVAPSARGRGVARRALGLLIDWALEHLDVLRIELRIAVENGASKRVAERAGYTREGVLRSLHFKQGIRADTELWSRLHDDPPPPSEPSRSRGHRPPPHCERIGENTRRGETESSRKCNFCRPAADRLLPWPHSRARSWKSTSSEAS